MCVCLFYKDYSCTVALEKRGRGKRERERERERERGGGGKRGRNSLWESFGGCPRYPINCLKINTYLNANFIACGRPLLNIQLHVFIPLFFLSVWLKLNKSCENNKTPVIAQDTT